MTAFLGHSLAEAAIYSSIQYQVLSTWYMVPYRHPLGTRTATALRSSSTVVCATVLPDRAAGQILVVLRTVLQSPVLCMPGNCTRKSNRYPTGVACQSGIRMSLWSCKQLLETLLVSSINYLEYSVFCSYIIANLFWDCLLSRSYVVGDRSSAYKPRPNKSDQISME